MSARYDCSDAAQRLAGISAAIEAVRAGELVVLPTDTVYGIAADAFTPSAVAALLAAKGRGRDMPPPVLVGTVRAAEALVEDLGAFGRDLIDEFWPGALTLVCTASKSLRWDLGDTKGTVAVRMPLHGVALDLLKQSGPLAVSSANLSGSPAATTVDEAQAQLGSAVSVYLDGGPCLGGAASTILDLTPTIPRLLRAGAIDVDRLRAVAAVITGDDTAGPEAPEAETAGPEAPETDTGGPVVPGADSTGPEAVRTDAVGTDAVGPEFKPAAPHPLAGGPPEASGGGTPPSA
jgi:tRNA threonylcarbamoyl adenosine modification protein (Sua5/YciO/YrdC/YwlC family)